MLPGISLTFSSQARCEDDQIISRVGELAKQVKEKIKCGITEFQVSLSCPSASRKGLNAPQINVDFYQAHSGWTLRSLWSDFDSNTLWERWTVHLQLEAPRSHEVLSPSQQMRELGFEIAGKLAGVEHQLPTLPAANPPISYPFQLTLK